MTKLISGLETLASDLSHSLLELRLESVLRFAIDNVTRLDRTSKIWVESADPCVEAVDKAIVETALFALIVSRIARPSATTRALLRLLLDVLPGLARTDRNKVYLMRYPQTAASLGITQIILASLGHPDAEFDSLIGSAFAGGHVDAVERLPYRRADLRWLKGLLQKEAIPSYDDIIPDLIISAPAHPIYMTAADAYALTHDLIYITDFGSRPVPVRADLSKINVMVDAALAWHLGTGNLDLLAELLVAAVLLRGPWSPYAQFAWSILNSTWNEFGFLPSPTFNTKDFGMLSGKDASDYVFRNVYHTTYVAGILAAILLNHPESAGEYPAAWIPPLPMARPSLLEICERVVAEASGFCRKRSLRRETSTTAADQNECDEMADDEQSDAIPILRDLLKRTKARNAAELERALEHVPLSSQMKTLVLVDTLLIIAAREYDLANLASLLVYAAECDVPVSPTFIEAVEFLSRQGLHSGAIGAHFAVNKNLSCPAASDITAGLAWSLSIAAARLAGEPGCVSSSKTGCASEFALSSKLNGPAELIAPVPTGAFVDLRQEQD